LETTVTGHRGLDMEEPLIFEKGFTNKTAVDLPEPPAIADRTGGLRRQGPIGLPGLSEPEVVRHYLRLSQKNFSIDTGFYPLGSCTMKHNPRLNEKLARFPGLGDLHPLQPVSTAQGALELIDACAHWLKVLTGLPAVAMSPAAGAHGELVGLMTIRAALEDRGDPRKRVLVPESAHGTNPATANTCGYAVESIPADARGRVDIAVLRDRLDSDVAAVMVTNPNTCGLFENDVREIAAATHEAGAFFYCDGANFNALVGRVRPADLGIDCMHINLHKTFSTPHGGGGPGSGPVVLSEALAPYAPVPYVVRESDRYTLVENSATSNEKPFGRIKGFHGQFGTFVRALAYMMSMGGDGLRQASSDAVLSANYILARLKGTFSAAFDGPCMHEALFDDRSLKGTGVTTLDLAKALIDQGFHPMTVYFPLVVHGAMLIEPTETESKETLDSFIDTMKYLAAEAHAGSAKSFHESPHLTPRRRLDETMAARHPVLRWQPPAVDQAAE
jgi:glycine dehydrogenase subunit 2